jgi:hypothetical protein
MKLFHKSVDLVAVLVLVLTLHRMSWTVCTASEQKPAKIFVKGWHIDPDHGNRLLGRSKSMDEGPANVKDSNNTSLDKNETEASENNETEVPSMAVPTAWLSTVAVAGTMSLLFVS